MPALPKGSTMLATSWGAMLLLQRQAVEVKQHKSNTKGTQHLAVIADEWRDVGSSTWIPLSRCSDLPAKAAQHTYLGVGG